MYFERTTLKSKMSLAAAVLSSIMRTLLTSQSVVADKMFCLKNMRVEVHFDCLPFNE